MERLNVPYRIWCLKHIMLCSWSSWMALRPCASASFESKYRFVHSSPPGSRRGWRSGRLASAFYAGYATSPLCCGKKSWEESSLWPQHSFNTVKWTWRSFYIKFLCFWILLRLDRWPVTLCPVWLIINYCAFDRLCLQCLMLAAFEYEIWDLPVWQVVLYRMWNKV